MPPSAIRIYFYQTDQHNQRRHLLRVLLAEPHPLVCEGVRRLLETQSDVAVIAEAETAEQALLAVLHAQLDLVIIDLALPPRGGREAIRAITAYAPTIAVVAMSPSDDAPYRRAVLQAGARALVRKDGQALLPALRTISRDEGGFPGERSNREHL